MIISKNLIKAFLVLFLLVILANAITPFFGVWNFYLGGLLILFVIVATWLLLRKSNPVAAKYLLLVVGGVIVAILLVFAVFFTVSIFSNSTKVHSYDIGGETDNQSPYLYPIDRLSNSSVQDITSITYRNITSFLVYFKVPAEYKTGNLTISLSLLENLPFGSVINLRGKNSTDWNYTSQLAYVSLGKKNLSSWKTATVQFNASDLIIENNTFTFAIESSHLSKALTKTNYVSLDKIEVSEAKKANK
jgi:hypothetical protein